ncbi:unnamed protein product [Lactuca saligna]|uniref:Uncharacterized protein n=1 Tax=Lactuca saligna TaxID=75948 RepID=A0AA35Z2L1_LACSI|nr:unnamed protein product [Lactuca saligna]
MEDVGLSFNEFVAAFSILVIPTGIGCGETLHYTPLSLVCSLDSINHYQVIFLFSSTRGSIESCSRFYSSFIILFTTLEVKDLFDIDFKNMRVADMHYGTGLTRFRDVLSSEFEWCSNHNTTLFLNRMIDAGKPDLFAFTDNIG